MFYLVIIAIDTFRNSFILDTVQIKEWISLIIGSLNDPIQSNHLIYLIVNIKASREHAIIERDNPYYFFRANQQKAGTKIYSLTQCGLTVNESDGRATMRELIYIVWLGYFQF